MKDLLRLARLDAGQEALDRAPCDTGALIGGVLRTCCRLSSPAASGRTEVVPVPPPCSGDAGRSCTDILRNLVENASNYSPEGSAITLRATEEDR